MINKITITVGVLVGTALGAAIGVLLAPDKGSETREKLKEEADNVRTKLTNETAELNVHFKESIASGKETFQNQKKKIEKQFETYASKASYKVEDVISFMEKQLAILKEKNKSLQKTS